MQRRLLLLGLLLASHLPAENLFVVQEGLGRVLVVNSSNPADRTTIVVGEKPHEIEVDRHQRFAYVSNFGLLEATRKDGTPGRTISVIDIVRKREKARYELPEETRAPHGLKLRPPHEQELFTNTEWGSEEMVVFHAESGRLLRRFPLPPLVHNFVFSDDGSALFAFTLDGKVLRVDPDSGAVQAIVNTGSPRGLTWTTDRRWLIVSGRGELLFLDPVTLATVKRFGDLAGGQIFYPLATPDGRYLFAPAVVDGVVLVLDAQSGQVLQRVNTGSPLLGVMASDQRAVWISNVLVPAGLFGPGTPQRPGGVTYLDLQTFATMALPDVVDANGLAAVSRH